jgi:DNA-directed RNA polymerase subunit M/transcription elongation factor TFIIS
MSISIQIKNPENFRTNIRTKLFDKIIQLLDTLELPVHGNEEKISTNIEKAIFNYAIKESGQRKIIKKWENPYFVQLYLDRLRTIFTNIDYPEIIRQIYSCELSTQNFVFMTHQEMNPERWSELIQQKIKRDASKFNTNIEASTDMFTCKKCKSKKCTYYELQTRSADEPATIFITCLDCGKHWKI